MNEEDAKQIMKAIINMSEMLKQEIQQVKDRLDKVEDRLDKVESKIDDMAEDITSIKLKNDVVDTTLLSHTYDINRLKKAK